MSKKILVVDDEPLIRRALLKLLGGKSHILFEAKDGAEGYQLWKRENPDLVILDILMPFKTGPQLLSELMPEFPNTKVILMSAYSGDFDLSTAQRMGANYFVAKPFEDLKSLVKIIDELL